METYSTGAKRSDHKPYYREIPVAALRRLGETLREGAIKYNEQPWDSNWQKGDLTFALDCIDHLGDHFACYAESVKARLSGKPTRDEEDHLGHLLANAAFLCWFEEQGMFRSRREETPDDECLVGDPAPEPPPDVEVVDPLSVASNQLENFFTRIFAPK